MRARWLLLLALGCGGADAPAPATTTAEPVAAAPAAEAAQPAAQEPAAEPAPTGPWWQAPEPQCATGDTQVQTLTWGRLVWCGDGNDLAAQRHQRDLGRLARCVVDAVGVLQSEPEPDALAAFVTRAIEAEVAPALCGAVRIDPGSPDVSTHDGRAVELHRALHGEDLYEDGGAVLGLTYRFSCASCDGFAETTVEVAVGPGGR